MAVGAEPPWGRVIPGHSQARDLPASGLRRVPSARRKTPRPRTEDSTHRSNLSRLPQRGADQDSVGAGANAGSAGGACVRPAGRRAFPFGLSNGKTGGLSTLGVPPSVAPRRENGLPGSRVTRPLVEIRRPFTAPWTVSRAAYAVDQRFQTLPSIGVIAPAVRTSYGQPKEPGGPIAAANLPYGRASGNRHQGLSVVPLCRTHCPAGTW